MTIPPTPEARQQRVVDLLAQLSVETILAGTRQRNYCLSLNLHSWAHSATFFINRIATGATASGATSDWADDLGFPLAEACKKPIWYDLRSLRNDECYTDAVAYLQKAVAAAKNL